MEKQKFLRVDALTVVRELLPLLQPRCARLVVAGSLRRGREEVGDVEILYIPRMIQAADPGDMFGKTVAQDDSTLAIEDLLARGILEKRPKVTGSHTWGPLNKLAIHRASGIPVDLFATTAASWWNYLVCRTGGAISNTRIATAAQQLGWKWNPYNVGFSRPRGLGTEIRAVGSEQDVFSFVGLDYQEPWQRP